MKFIEGQRLCDLTVVSILLYDIKGLNPFPDVVDNIAINFRNGYLPTFHAQKKSQKGGEGKNTPTLFLRISGVKIYRFIEGLWAILRSRSPPSNFQDGFKKQKPAIFRFHLFFTIQYSLNFCLFPSEK